MIIRTIRANPRPRSKLEDIERFALVGEWLAADRRPLIYFIQMPSGCAVCQQLAEVYVGYCRDLEWTISRQKLEAMRHAFEAISAYDSEVERLSQLRRDAVSRITDHVQEHRTAAE